MFSNLAINDLFLEDSKPMFYTFHHKVEYFVANLSKLELIKFKK